MSILKKRVLLTTQSLVDVAGAELNLLSIAKELTNMDYKVEIGTFKFADPIKSIFEQNNLNVKNLIHQNLEYNEYDIIWSHHSPTIYNVLLEKNIRADKVIFSSLSPFEPLEAPPVFINDLSICLANSYETRDQLIRENVDSGRIHVFPNYAPPEFIENDYTGGKEINNICIVSNHVPDELLEAKRILSDQNINVDIFGIGHIKEVVTSSLLLKYDAVITIGKTVQFALVMGMPVFCYDIHGGPGWLDNNNYDNARFHNFSGRGFNMKFSGSELVRKLLDGFDKAKDFSLYIKDSAKKDYDLITNLNVLLNMLDSLNVTDCEVIVRKFKSIIRANQAFIREYEYKNYYKNLALEFEEDSENLKLDREKIIGENKRLQESINQHLDGQRLLLEEQQLLNEKIQKNILEINKIETEKIQMNQLLIQLESEFNAFREFKHAEVQQKDNNSAYLLELVEEKNKIINNMLNTRVWKSAEILRKIRNKSIKVMKDPTLVIKKLRKKGRISQRR